MRSSLRAALHRDRQIRSHENRRKSKASRQRANPGSSRFSRSSSLFSSLLLGVRRTAAPSARKWGPRSVQLERCRTVHYPEQEAHRPRVIFFSLSLPLLPPWEWTYHFFLSYFIAFRSFSLVITSHSLFSTRSTFIWIVFACYKFPAILGIYMLSFLVWVC